MRKSKDQELQRLHKLTEYEREVRSQGFSRVAGIDEAGRGPLAGPVVAAACVIPEGVLFRGVDDSKKLAPEAREELFLTITSHPQVVYSYGVIDSGEIDRINIYQATIRAMLEAIARLSHVPEYLLVDGLQLPHPSIPVLKIIQGDCKSHSIAAASIIAKVIRDRLMVEFDVLWPHYGFKQHKGYGTPQHLSAIMEFGPCPIHRMSFAPLKDNKGH